jgi:ATP-dependent DNA helicase PIF1
MKEKAALIRIEPQTTTFQGKGNTIITRRQLPLILSWAVTMHKTQGLILKKAIIYLRGCFSYNMEYVAISRLKTLEGLAIKTLDLPRLVRCKYTSPESWAS